MNEIAKLFFLIGVFFIFAAGIMVLWSKFPFPGRLPGDIVIKRENFTFYFPIMTSVILSLVLSVILFFLHRK